MKTVSSIYQHVCSVPHPKFLCRTPYAQAAHVSPSPRSPRHVIIACYVFSRGIRAPQRERRGIYGCPTALEPAVSHGLHPSLLVPEPPPHAAVTSPHEFSSVTPEVRPVLGAESHSLQKDFHPHLLVRTWVPCLPAGSWHIHDRGGQGACCEPPQGPPRQDRSGTLL